MRVSIKIQSWIKWDKLHLDRWSDRKDFIHEKETRLERERERRIYKWKVWENDEYEKKIVNFEKFHEYSSIFSPDLISLWNRWSFKWSRWNGWCWTSKIEERFGERDRSETLRKRRRRRANEDEQTKVKKRIRIWEFSFCMNMKSDDRRIYRSTYIGEIGGGKPPGCGLALPCWLFATGLERFEKKNKKWR